MTTTRRRRAAGVTLAGVVLAGLTLAGCGIPVDRNPTVLPRSGVPFGLLRPSTATTTTATTPSPVDVAVPIFFVASSSGRLVEVTREVPAAQESLTTVLGALVAGPTNAEAAGGLESELPAQTTVLGATTGTGGIATIDLGGTFGQLVGQSQIQAVAQLVFTTTALAGVTDVTFQLNGQPVMVPVASGAQVPVVSRSQFSALAPL